MLQHVKNNDQGTNNSEVITSVNCAGITLCSSPFSLNLHVDSKGYTKQTWIIDSGATEHMSYNKDFFFYFKPLPKTIYVNLPNFQKVQVSYSGSVQLSLNLIIHRVLFVPSFHFNLLSAHKLCKQLSNMLIFTSSHSFMQGPSMKRPMLIGESQNGLYLLKTSLSDLPSTNASSSFHSSKDVTSSLSCISFSDIKSKLWHVRLGHIPLSNIQHINEISVSLCSKFSVPCFVCPLAKQHKLPFPSSHIASKQIFDLIYIDTWGPFQTPTYDDFKYFFDHCR